MGISQSIYIFFHLQEGIEDSESLVKAFENVENNLQASHTNITKALNKLSKEGKEVEEGMAAKWEEGVAKIISYYEAKKAIGLALTRADAARKAKQAKASASAGSAAAGPGGAVPS